MRITRLKVWKMQEARGRSLVQPWLDSVTLPVRLVRCTGLQ